MTRRALGNAHTEDLGLAFGLRLKKARERAGLTQEELAARAGVSRVTVASWELGRGGGARLDQVKAAAAALRTHPGRLAFGGKG